MNIKPSLLATVPFSPAHEMTIHFCFVSATPLTLINVAGLGSPHTHQNRVSPTKLQSYTISPSATPSALKYVTELHRVAAGEM